MYPNCAAIGQHAFTKQVKPRSSYKLCTAAFACLNKQIISDNLHHLLSALSLYTGPSIDCMFLKRKVNNFLGLTFSIEYCGNLRHLEAKYGDFLLVF